MKIILNDKEVSELATESLPMLIHGADKSGSSLCTISLAAEWYKHGYDVLFVCGYPAAEEEFVKLVGKSNGQFFTKEKQEEFKSLLSEAADKRVIFVKNVELFADIFDLISQEHNLVISGDVNKSSIKEKILAHKYVTRIYFSEIEGVVLPNLNKYEGYVIADDFKGVTKLQP